MAGNSSSGLAALDFIEAAVWLFGFSWEVAGDTQLALFKRDPANKGKVMQAGARRYTCHPNYFGESVLWWGIWLVAAAAGGYWSVYGPAIITFMLLRVSGVTLLEKGRDRRQSGLQGVRRADQSLHPLAPSADWQETIGVMSEEVTGKVTLVPSSGGTRT
jgi:steroid 5-alpha reductase family enzyme